MTLRPPREAVTALLLRWRQGDTAALDQLMTVVYASDIPFFMNNQALKYGDRVTARDNAAGEVISRFVVQFVKSDPRDPRIAGWTRYQRRGGKMMDFSRQETAELVDDPWGVEIDAASPSRYPGMPAGGARGRGGRGDR
jgi:hypothetical protein